MSSTDCPECAAYADRRKTVLLAAITDHCAKTGEKYMRTLARYMGGVHERHMSGKTLATD